MSENEKFENLAEVFKALSHPIRVEIVTNLITRKEECNVTKMVECLGISQPNVSQHLNILKNAGIIKGFRKGNNICYRVVDEQVIKMLSNNK